MHIKVYVSLCLILLIAVGIYSFFKFQEYQLIREGIAKSEQLIVSLRDEVSETKTQYDTNKKDFDQLDKVLDQNMQSVFPATDNYTELTRQFDAYEESLAQNLSPFEVSSIEYQSPIESENYSVLPLRMNIRSSVENFTKFLHLIEESGAFDSSVRLMSVSSIKLNFQAPTGDELTGETINFTVQINAYFQK